MSQVKTINGQLTLDQSTRIAILCGRFNAFVVEQLEAGCIDMLMRHGAVETDLTVIKVPGAFEMPVVAKKVAESGDYDVIIGLGAVIRGGTPHFEHVAGACSRGLSTVATDTGVPVIFGVQTTYTTDQAYARIGHASGYAEASVEMANLLRTLNDA